MQLSDTPLDVLVVGGGINGAGIAADAAGRGLKVGLYETGDFACATSSASSKLVHGGLRYLEQFEFRLVGESLKEREILLKKAPHIIFPMRFRLPHRPFLRPAWMIRIGLFLYDHLGHRNILPASCAVDLKQTGLFKKAIKKGFEYSDCWVDDARLVVLNILAAHQNGAEVSNYCTVENAQRKGDMWFVQLHDQRSGQRFQRQAKAIVNAAGPWVERFFQTGMAMPSPRHIRLIKGSHIVVPKLNEQDEAYILQNDDKRIVFVIPYLEQFSMIGTTDIEYQGDPSQVTASESEINYLLDVVNQHFIKQSSRHDVIWTFSGVRPLCDDESDTPQTITRDYTIEIDDHQGLAPIVSVFGGKLTSYRKLAESTMEQLRPYFKDMHGPWTKDAILPGGAITGSTKTLIEQWHRKLSWLDQATIARYVGQYGMQIKELLADVNKEEDMGHRFADGVYSREIDYLIDHEFAFCSEDILWRRTKLGLTLQAEQKNDIAHYIEQHRQEVSARQTLLDDHHKREHLDPVWQNDIQTDEAQVASLYQQGQQSEAMS